MKLESEVPTRAEIAKLLAETGKAKGKKTEKAARNKVRRDKVRQVVTDNDVFEKLETDLASYPEWEIEAEEPVEVE